MLTSKASEGSQIFAVYHDDKNILKEDISLIRPPYAKLIKYPKRDAALVYIGDDTELVDVLVSDFHSIPMISPRRSSRANMLSQSSDAVSSSVSLRGATPRSVRR